MDKVRVDKWLWAARIYKTRALAKVAVESGKVKLDGKKIKPSRQIEIDDTLLIRKNYDDFTIEIKDLAESRVSAAKSRILYEETPKSIDRRKVERAQRKLQHSVAITNGRPNKKQRRLIHKLLES